jgi:hypothetical protein
VEFSMIHTVYRISYIVARITSVIAMNVPVSLSDAKSWKSSSYTRWKVKKGSLHVWVTHEKWGGFVIKRK